MSLKVGGFDFTDIRGFLPEAGEFPFQVVRVKSTDKNNPQIGVISNSHLFNSEDADTYEENNDDWGLLDDEKTQGGFSVENIGDKIWLEIKLDKDQIIQEIQVKHGKVGTEGAWDEYPNPIAINIDDPNNPFQEYYNQIIAEITDRESDPRPGFVISKGEDGKKLQITQCLFTNLMMTAAHTTKDSSYPNLALSVPIPWNSPATDASGNADEINEKKGGITPWQLGTLPLDFPFQVFMRSTEDGKKEVAVNPNSALFGSYDFTDTMIIDGFNDDGSLTWFNVDDEEKIWLECSVSGGSKTSLPSLDSAKIDHSQKGWQDFGSPVKIKKEAQEKAFLMIATITTDDDSGELKVDQNIYNNQRMQGLCYNNVNIIYPHPV
jgi:hypothetical protein